MATKWEFINFCFLPSQIKDSDLSIRDTTAETRLWVWLVLTIPVTPGGAAAHDDNRIVGGCNETVKEYRHRISVKKIPKKNYETIVKNRDRTHSPGS